MKIKKIKSAVSVAAFSNTLKNAIASARAHMQLQHNKCIVLEATVRIENGKPVSIIPIDKHTKEEYAYTSFADAIESARSGDLCYVVHVPGCKCQRGINL